jgi:N-acyl homoserine lactone hydrolase
MRIHAIQTGTVVVKRRQLRGKGNGVLRLFNTISDPNWVEPLPIYTWLIEHPEGLIVVDTGETARASEPGYFPSWQPYYRFAVRLSVRVEEEIGPQIRALGFSPADVRWVVLTHMHTDHAGGLAHFPQSEILVSRTEYRLASSLQGWMLGYLPHRWPTWFTPRQIDFATAPSDPFPSSYPLTQAGDVILVPTPGHAPGHLSVIVQDGATTVFLAGDTSYNEQLLLDGVMDGVTTNLALASKTMGRIQRFLQTTPTIYLPSHDPESANRLARGRLTSLPAL